MAEDETTWTPASGKHDAATCAPRPDGDGGTRPCTHWDHDAKLG